MLNEIANNTNELLTEISTEEQQVLTGGRYYGGYGYYPYYPYYRPYYGGYYGGYWRPHHYGYGRWY